MDKLAEEFEKWMKEEDDRKKNYIYVPEPTKEKIKLPQLIIKKKEQLSLF